MPVRLDAVSPKLVPDDGGPEPPSLYPPDVGILPPGKITVMPRTRSVRLQGSPPVSAFAASVTPTMMREGVGMYSNADNDQGRRKKKSPWKAVWDFLFLVMQTSSIHGFNHVTDDKRHVLERILWTAFVLLGLYGAVVVSLSTWDHYQENPTVIAMERDYKEWNTSFPSVTICPTIKYDEANVNRVAESLTHIQDKERLKLFLMTLANATFLTFSEVIDDFNDQIKPSDYMDLVLAVKLDFSYSISGSNDEASGYPLQPTITEHGICYAFNSDVAVYTSPEYFKAKNRTIIDRGWSYVGSPLDGEMFAQVVQMNSGYLLFMHSCNETLDFSAQHFPAEADTFKTQEVSALSIITSDEAASLKVEQRRCRFLAESNLMLSPAYSYNLCRTECRMKLAHEQCGCVPHFYRPVPRLTVFFVGLTTVVSVHLNGLRRACGENYPFKICDVKGLHCLDKYKVLMSTLRDPVTNKKVDCKCLPSCIEVNYITENDHTISWFMGTCLKWGMSKYPRMRLKRDVLFGFIDVLVSVGGTAGLFLGCSVLSFIEIIYFFTLKAFLYVTEHYKDKQEDEDGERPESVDSGQAIVPRMFTAASSFSTVHLH